MSVYSVFFLWIALISASSLGVSPKHRQDFGHGRNSHQPSHHSVAAHAVSRQTLVNMPFRQPVNGSTPAGWIQIGTPKKWLLAIFDTGSDKLVAKTWDTVATELASVDAGISGMVMPSMKLYDHSKSTSYQRKFIKNPKTGKMVAERASITYGSGTAVTDVGTETVLVGNRKLDNFTVMEITKDSLQMLHTSKGLAGVLGLQHMKNKSLGNSLFSRMRDADMLTSFGYCRGAENNGVFIWGDTSKEGTQLDVIGQMHWAVNLGGVKLGSASSASLVQKNVEFPFPEDGSGYDMDMDTGDDSDPSNGKPQVVKIKVDGSDAGGKGGDAFKAINDIFKAIAHNQGAGMDAFTKHKQVDYAKVLKESCSKEKCTAILDTGSNIMAGPTDAIKSLTKLVNIKSDCSNFAELPNIEMNFGGMPVTMKPHGYVMKVPMPKWADSVTTANEEGESAVDSQDADQDALEDDAIPEDGKVVVEVAPGYVKRHRDYADEASLAESDAAVQRAQLQRKWKAVFEEVYKSNGVDLRDMVDEILKSQKHTEEEFMCMPALVPLDKKTQYGPLWVVGTPLLDSYYARWSFDKKDASPKIHLQALEDCKTCKDGEVGSESTPVLLRSEKGAEKANTRLHSTGPAERLPEDITYPHWAKDLSQV